MKLRKPCFICSKKKNAIWIKYWIATDIISPAVPVFTDELRYDSIKTDRKKTERRHFRCYRGKAMKQIHMIMYHYVRDLKNSAYPAIKGLDKALFEEQIEYLLKHFHPLRMEDILQAYREQDFSSVAENGFLLTFDDGYIDHYEVVYPILKKFGIQGAFFPNAMALKEHKLLTVNRIHFILAEAEVRGREAMTELVQDCFGEMDEYRKQGLEIPANAALYNGLAVANRWDPAEVIFVKRLLQNALPEDIRTEIAKRLFQKYVGREESDFARELYLDTGQMRQMREDGMFFGLHGYDHYWLGKLDAPAMEQDIEKALAFMKDVINPNEWVMNYPYGNYSDVVIDYIKTKGCALGVSVEARAAKLGEDNRFALPRWDCNDVYPKGTMV